MILLQKSMLDGLTGDDIRIEKVREKLERRNTVQNG